MKEQMNVVHFEIKFVRHTQTGLIVAYSPDHAGVMIHGRTFGEVKQRIPEAVRAIFEAEGKEIISIEEDADGETAGSGFMPSSARFHASLSHAA